MTCVFLFSDIKSHKCQEIQNSMWVKTMCFIGMNYMHIGECQSVFE